MTKTTPKKDWFNSTEKNLLEYLIFASTGIKADFATGLGTNSKMEYQVMIIKDYLESFPIDEFWWHHIENNPQWFNTPLEAAAHFVQRRHEWIQRELYKGSASVKRKV